MDAEIKILMVEDRIEDAKLIKHEIKKNNINFIEQIVETKEEYIKALKNFEPDIILSDYDLPTFNGIQALSIREELAPLIPFILVTGSINEETAVTVMKAGADDYIIKEHIVRLGPAIKSALEKMETLRSKSEAEKKIKILSRAIEQNPACIVITNTEGIIEYVNPKFIQLTGYSLEEVIGKNPKILKSGNTPHELYNELWQTISSGNEWQGVFQNRKKNGETFFESSTISPIIDDNGNITHFVAVKEDITERKQAEEIVNRERKLLRTLIDNLPDAVYVKDREARKLAANVVDMQIMKCWSESDFIGKTDIDIYNEENGEKGYTEDLKVINTGVPLLNHEDSYVDDSNKTHWRLISKIPLFDDQGNTIGLVGIGKDITERKLAEEELAWEQYLMHSLLDNIPDNIFFKDLQSKFIRVNKSMANLFGLISPVNAIGMSDKDYFNPEQAEQTSKDEQEIIKTRVPIIDKVEVEILKDKAPTYVSTTKMPLIDTKGNVIGTFGISRDVTEKTKMLEDLTIAKEKAEESDRLKTAFLNNISHEIRTPMNAIIGFSELLNNTSLPPDKHKKHTETIIKSSRQLLSIITNIINISTIEAGQHMVYDNLVDLNSIFKQMSDQFTPTAKKNNITLTYTTSLPNNEAIITTDIKKVTEILNHLIGNALKFTEEGYVKFGYTLKLNEIECYVEDTGIGIAPEFHNEIFNRFRQIELTESRLYGGSGLGLTISKAYTEILGGKLWLNSESGKGSTFYFTIPYRKANNTIAHIESEKINEDFTNSVKKILIVEDEEINYLLLKELLSEDKYILLFAENGAKAIEICKSTPDIDLVLMDVKMPIMNGYVATKHIKSIYPELPVIAVTAYSNNQDKIKAIESGCNDFISKPFKQEELIFKIRKNLIKNN